jgi:hypothetical protein
MEAPKPDILLRKHIAILMIHKANAHVLTKCVQMTQGDNDILQCCTSLTCVSHPLHVARDPLVHVQSAFQ